MEIKVGDKFIRVWDSKYPLGVVEVEEIDVENDEFCAQCKEQDYWWYKQNDLKAYAGDIVSILAPINNLTTLLYLGENNG